MGAVFVGEGVDGCSGEVGGGVGMKEWMGGEVGVGGEVCLYCVSGLH